MTTNAVHGGPRRGNECARRLPRALASFALLILFVAQGARADLAITANGGTGPVTVTVGETVSFEVTDTPGDCSDSWLYQWRDRWLVDGDVEEETTSGDSPCGRSPVSWSRSFPSAGTYTVTFDSDYQLCFFGCGGDNDYDTAQIEVNVVAPPGGAEPVAEYRMEDGGWSGAADEVADASGNGLDGTAFNGPSIADADPAIGGDPGTCAYGTFDGSDQYLEVGDDPQLDLEDELTVTAWIHPQSIPGSGLMTIVSKDENFEFHVNADNEINWWWGGPSLTSSGANIAVGQWYHVAITYEAGEQRIYVNGNEVAYDNQSGSLPSNSDPMQIGSDQGLNDRYFDGRIDEVRVYDAALSAGEVAEVQDLTHPCAGTEGLIAEYRMDETGWSGASGEVADTGGNGLDGTARTNGSDGSFPDTVPAKVCNGGRFRGQGFNEPDGQYVEAQHYVEIPDADALSPLADTGEMTISGWFRANSGSGGTLVHKGAGYPGQEYRVYYEGGQLHATVWSRYGDETADLSGSVTPGTWYFFAMTADNPNGNRLVLELRMYNDGGQVDSTSRTNQSFFSQYDDKPLPDNLLLGAISYGPGNVTDYLDGTLDEVRIHDRVLSDSELTDLRDTTRPCDDGGVDHYAIDVGAGTASTCQPRAVTVTAEDSADNPVTDYTGTVDLATSSGHGTWSTATADGPFADTTADDGAASYGFVDSDNGSIELDLSNQHADDLDITVAEDDGSPSSTSATLSFRDNAFVIDSIDSLGGDVVAGRNHDLRVSLWRRDPSTGACGIADAYNAAAQAVKLWLDRHADDPGGPTPGVAQQTTGGGLPDSAPGGANAVLDFSAATLGQAGRAPLTLEPDDVGRYTLRILDDTSGFAQDPAGNPLPIIGATDNDLVVRPFGFHVGANGNPAAEDAGGAAYRAGGEDFDVTVTAVQWQAADDADDDGVPDGHDDADPANNVDLSDNPAAASFGQEGTPESVDVTAALWKPAGQSDPGLAGGEPLIFGGFSGGASTQATAWNEVGIIELAAALADGNYLAGGRGVTGRSGPVGRFHPARLRVTVVTTPAFRDGTGMWGSPFTYMGQEFTFGSAALPRIEVAALSADGATVLANYGGDGAGVDADFWRLTGTPARGYADATPADTDADFAADSGAGSVTWDLGAGDTRADYDGRGTFEISGDTFVYDRIDAATRQVPFEALVDLQIERDDLDDGDACHDPEDDGICDPFTVEDITGTELRYGRLVAGNVSGSERVSLDMPVIAEYWTDESGDDAGWEVNEHDGSTTLDLAGDIDLTNETGDLGSITTVDGNQTIDLANAPNGGSTELATGTTDPVQLTGGRAILRFAAPGGENTGWAAAIPRLGAVHADQPWLRFDWATDGAPADGALDDDPRARATFGIYTGPESRILIREVPAN